MRIVPIAGLLLALAGCAEKPAPVGAADAAATLPVVTTAATCPAVPVALSQNPVLWVAKEESPPIGGIQLSNCTGAPVRLALSLGELMGLDGDLRPQPLGAYAKLEASAAADKAIAEGAADLAPGKSLALSVTPPAAWAAAAATATLSNAGRELGVLRIARQQPPFGLRMDGASPNEATLTLITGGKGLLSIRNNDPMAYRFGWRIAMGDDRLQGTAYVAAHSTVDLPVKPSREFLDEFLPFRETAAKGRWFGGLLRNGTLRSATPQGTLTLRWEPGIAGLAAAIPEKSIPLKSRMSFFGTNWQFALNNVSIVVLLLVGVLLSWAMNFGLPNQARRVALKQRLAEINSRIHDLRGGISQRLIAVVDREYLRLRQELGERFWFSPEFTTALPKLDEGVANLETRLVLLRRSAELLRRLEEASGELPPTVALETRAACLSALGPFQQSTLEKAELDRVREKLTEAEGLAVPGATPERLKTLKQREERLNALVPKLDQMAGTEWSALGEAMRGLFQAFAQRGPLAEAMDAAEFRLRDSLISRVEALERYVALQAASVDQDERAKRASHLAELRRAISPGPEHSQTRAASLLEQMEKNAYVEDLAAAIQAGACSIDVDPPSVDVNEVVELSVKFESELLNCSHARQDIGCEWLFRELGGYAWFRSKSAGDSPAEARREWRDRGWSVSLAFFTTGTYEVRVTFLQRGVGAVAVNGAPATKTKFIRVRKAKAYARSRLRLELIRLGGLVLVLLFPLVAGAQEKLGSMDPLAGSLAVVALGFTADTVVKRLTQSA